MQVFNSACLAIVLFGWVFLAYVKLWEWRHPGKAWIHHIRGYYR